MAYWFKKWVTFVKIISVLYMMQIQKSVRIFKRRQFTVGVFVHWKDVIQLLTSVWHIHV